MATTPATSVCPQKANLEPPAKILKRNHAASFDISSNTTAALDPETDYQQDYRQVAAVQSLVTWLTDQGAELPSITFAPSPHGGLGAFASSEEGIAPGGLIGRIPNAAVMSVRRSAKSLVGLAVASTTFSNDKFGSVTDPSEREDAAIVMSAPCRPTKEFVLWLDMIHGRSNPSHPYHPYLASLPAQPVDAPSWSPSQRSGLEGTNLGKAAEAASKELTEQYEKWMPQLRKAHPGLFGKDDGVGLAEGKEENCKGDFGYKDLRWARSMYYSRRFPSMLLVEEDNGMDKEVDNKRLNDGNDKCTTNPSGDILDEGREGEVDNKKGFGILLPLFDLLNHDPHCQISWFGSPTHVSFSAGPNSGIPSGSEIYNNYGPKGNEQLMMMYGFALRDNVHDSFGLQLVMKIQTPSGDGGMRNKGGSNSGEVSAVEKRSLGMFQIHRRDSPIHSQFPQELWHALSQLFEPEENGSGKAASDSSTDYAAGTYGEKDGEADQVEIGVEAVELLLDTLQSRVRPFLATADVDHRCETDVARYRNGQRVVLVDAIETLQEMMPAGEEQSAGHGRHMYGLVP